MTLRVAQIVPRLQPGHNGLGDYARLLAQQLARHDIAATFIAAGTERKEDRPSEPGNSIYLDAANGDALTRALVACGANAAVLHFAGYGYASNGAPHWLAQGLENFREKSGAAVIVMFHETWSKPLPWKRNFFAALSQRSLVRRLLSLSACCVTNARVHERELLRMNPQKQIAYLPVLSNVGEIDRIERKDERLAAVFGRARAKERIYRDLASSVQALGHLGISSIVDIGERVAEIPPRLRRLVTETGPLDAADVSAHLRTAKFGLFRYPVRYVGKSGLFAAYAAHGVCPVNLWRRALDDNESWLARSGDEADGVEPGRSYLPWTGLRKNPQAALRNAAEVSLRAWQWYQTHNANVTGRAFAEMIAEAAMRRDS